MSDDSSTDDGKRRTALDSTLGFALATSSEVTALMANLNCGMVGHSENEQEIIEKIDSRMESLQYNWDVFKEHYDDK